MLDSLFSNFSASEINLSKIFISLFLSFLITSSSFLNIYWSSIFLSVLIFFSVVYSVLNSSILTLIFTLLIFLLSIISDDSDLFVTIKFDAKNSDLF